MFTRKFWQDTVERVIGTAAAVAVSSGVLSAATSMDWKQAATLTGLAALATLFKCLAASRTGDPQSASLLGWQGPTK